MSRERYIQTFLFDVALTPRSNLLSTRKSAILPEVKENSLNRIISTNMYLKLIILRARKKIEG